ncbi:PAS domain-containing protein [bacterium]|nr:PAS domain-containing protein [bacterium]
MDLPRSVQHLAELTKTIRGEREPEAVASALFQTVRQLLPIERIGLYRFDQAQLGLSPVGMDSLDVLDMALTFKEEGVADFAAETNQPLLAPVPPNFASRNKQKEDQNALLLPINMDDTPFCILFAVLGEENTGELDETQKAMLSFVSEIASSSLQHAIVFNEANTMLKYLERLLSAVQDVIYATDEAGLITYVNQRVEKFGRASREVMGQPLYQLIPFEQEQGRTIQVLQKGESFTYDVELPIEGHGTRWFQVNQAPIYDRSKEIIGSLGILRDITERRSLEERLREAERMNALTEAAVGINHEINNPLSVIQGNLYLLEHYLPMEQNPKAMQQFQVLRQHTERIAKVVKKLDRIEQLRTVDYAGKLRMLELGDMEESPLDADERIEEEDLELPGYLQDPTISPPDEDN